MRNSQVLASSPTSLEPFSMEDYNTYLWHVADPPEVSFWKRWSLLSYPLSNAFCHNFCRVSYLFLIVLSQPGQPSHTLAVLSWCRGLSQVAPSACTVVPRSPFFPPPLQIRSQLSRCLAALLHHGPVIAPQNAIGESPRRPAQP
jgi:hypothetical protein